MNIELATIKPVWNGNYCAFCGIKVISEDKEARCCSYCRVYQKTVKTK